MDRNQNKKNNAPRRRVPGQSKATTAPQKAPHVQPRRNQPVQEQPVHVTPEVVYLAPKPFSRNRLILRLATVVAVVLALMMGLSIFFKVEKIEVSGCSQYTAWQIQQASGIEYGDQLLTFSVPRAAGKIRNALPYVKTVRIGISLPDTVKIEIVETAVTYGFEDQNGNLWLVDSAGKIVEQATAGSRYAKISGVTIDNPVVGGQALAHPDDGIPTDPEGNTLPVTVTAGQKFNAILQIAQGLERYGIIGQIASVDVTDYYGIQLWYGEKFHVLLGDTNELDRKIRYLKAFVDDYTENRPYEAGVLDLTDPNWIEYSSFPETTE